MCNELKILFSIVVTCNFRVKNEIGKHTKQEMILIRGKGYRLNQEIFYVSNILFSNLVICFLS